MKKHAIVIGGSMGGLMAARALSDHFERVTLIERDEFPEVGEHRRGVPQGRHAHALLARGSRELEELFPGITKELVARGAEYGDLSEQSLWFLEGGYHARRGCDIKAIALSRPLLEGHVRTRVGALANVILMEGCDVAGLTTDESRSRVTGVRVLRRASGSAEEVIEADLVVDAAGRGSRVPAWLEDLGYSRPEEERLQVSVGYASRTFRRRPEDLGGAKALVISASGARARGGVIIAQEGDRWLATLGGYFGDYPPTDERGFLEFARSLEAPEFYELVSKAEPLTDSVSYKYAAYQWRHYERLARFPAGLLVYGDAICSFNPLYAQGMTVSIAEAKLLSESLRHQAERTAPEFFGRTAKLISVPWRLATGGDLRFDELEAPRPLPVRIINRYLVAVHHAAHRDPAVSHAFLRVANLLAPPASVLKPSVVLRVILANLRGRRAARVARPGEVAPAADAG